MRLALACVVLCGCAMGVPMPAADVSRTFDAWREAGRAYPAECAEARDDMRLVVTEGERFEDLCRVPACSVEQQSACSESCVVFSEPAVVVTPATNLPGHKAHELLHELQFCGEQTIDYSHTDHDVWGRPDGLLGKLGG